MELAFQPVDGAGLFKRLAPLFKGVRGRFSPDFPMRKITWFRTGGPAELLFQPENEDDLAQFLRKLPADVPLTIVGIGSNLLVRDGGVKGIVVRLPAKGFGHIVQRGEADLLAGAGASDKSLAAVALQAGLLGFHFYAGIPGGLGGALKMNAGANEEDTAARLVEAYALDRHGESCVLPCSALGYSYRHCAGAVGLIFTGALLRGKPASKKEIETAMAQVLHHRETVQPVREKTGGSTFRNPQGQAAWKLIDEAGCRGLTIGGAQMSVMHCNFMINTGNASAYDLELLGKIVKKRVFDKSGYQLHWEIQRIGQFAPGQGLDLY